MTMETDLDPRAEYLAKLSDSEAAEMWGISRQAVNELRRRLGVPHPPTQYEVFKAAVLAAAASGKTITEIADELGASERRVRTVLLKADKPLPTNLAPCGTRTAYNRHLRRGEPVDDACRIANNLDSQRRRKT